MNRGFLVIIVLGACGFVFGCMEWQLKTVAKETPQTISAAELVGRGYGDNANVNVTGVSLCDDFVAYEKNNRWQKVWVPAVPAGQPCGGNIRLIVVDTSCKSEADVAMMDTGSIQGLIINKIASLGGEEKRKLEEKYGPMGNVLILQRNRGTWPSMGVIAMMGIGGFAFFSGLALTAAGIQKR
jgi:hypothetical protein